MRITFGKIEQLFLHKAHRALYDTMGLYVANAPTGQTSSFVQLWYLLHMIIYVCTTCIESFAYRSYMQMYIQMSRVNCTEKARADVATLATADG